MSKLRIVQSPSPNHSSRGGVPIDTIVIHSTGGRIDGALSWLQNAQSQVSAHYLISRDGTIFKLVPVSRAAWHAGSCPGLPNANRRSIGIEMEQLTTEKWTDAQVEVLERLIRILKRAIPTIKYLYGHKEINPRKWDPYGINMNQWREKAGLTTL